MATDAHADHLSTGGISATNVVGASFTTGNLDEAAEFVLDRVAHHGEPDRV